MTLTKTTVVGKILALSAGDLTLNIKSCSISLDESKVPYGSVEIVVALPNSATLAEITPYGSLRVEITVTHEWVTPVRAPQTRTFNFLLHERTVDHVAATLALRGETDEALLLDRRNVSAALARTYGLSVKTACEYALTQIGAVLEAGAIDANLTSKALEPVVTNLIKNPTGATAATWWTTGFSAAGGINTVAAAVPGVAHQGKAIRCIMAAGEQYGLYLNGSATSAAAVNLANLPVLTPGKKYTVSAYLRSSTTRSFRIDARTLTAAGATITTNVGASTAMVANVWQRFSITFTAEATAAYLLLFGEAITTFWAAGDTLDMAGAMLAEGDLIDYFDGATADTPLYDFAWSGTANQSTSTKTNLPNTDATIWQPGQSLDDWLAPMLQASNRRLFCDERRKWRLVDASYSVDGRVTISEGFNAKTGTDIMSRQKSEQGVPTWFDHVAVHYTWKDAAGVAQEQWDFASAGTVKGFTFAVNSPWPGPGAAAAILARANGRGRTLDVSALSDYLTTPGMAIVTTLPGTPIQTGVTSSVTWRWSDSTDEMTVTSRGLISTPPNAWLFAVGPWSAATGSWAAAVGTN